LKPSSAKSFYLLDAPESPKKGQHPLSGREKLGPLIVVHPEDSVFVF